MPINTVSDVLGSSGEAMEWKSSSGKSYKLSLMNLKGQSKIERMIESDALNALSAHKELIGPEEYHKQLTKTLRDISQGKYSFGGELCQEALQTIKGVSALVSAIFNVDRDEALTLLTSEPEVKEVISMVTERSFPKKVEAGQVG